MTPPKNATAAAPGGKVLISGSSDKIPATAADSTVPVVKVDDGSNKQQVPTNTTTALPNTTKVPEIKNATAVAASAAPSVSSAVNNRTATTAASAASTTSAAGGGGTGKDQIKTTTNVTPIPAKDLKLVTNAPTKAPSSLPAPAKNVVTKETKPGMYRGKKKDEYSICIRFLYERA